MSARCPWAGNDDLMVDYHDKEWGFPVYDDRVLFEFIILEGCQAGLSWSTVLKKRENYRKAFDNFDAVKIARYRQKKIDTLLNNPGIIRNKLKVNAAVKNARGFLDIQKEFGSFAKYIWSFTENKPIVNKWKTLKEMPAETELAKTISKDLKKRGFSFVGPTIIYSFMQAVGIVNDHLISCPQHKEVQKYYKRLK